MSEVKKAAKEKIDKLRGTAIEGSAGNEVRALQMELIGIYAEHLTGALANLEASMNKNAASGKSLARVVVILDFALAAATIVMAIGTYYIAIR